MMGVFLAVWSNLESPLGLWSLPALTLIEVGGMLWWLTTRISFWDCEVEMFP